MNNDTIPFHLDTTLTTTIVSPNPDAEAFGHIVRLDTGRALGVHYPSSVRNEANTVAEFDTDGQALRWILDREAANHPRGRNTVTLDEVARLFRGDTGKQ